MPPGHKPNPFSKVTEETSMSEHERRLIRARIAAERKKAAKQVDTACTAKAVGKTVAANKSIAPTTPSPSAASSSKPTPKARTLTKAKLLAPGVGTPLRKKRSGLRGVALTFTHYGVKKVTRRPSALLMQSVKVPRVLPLPGQENVPLTDSDEEEAGGDTGGEETDEGGDAGDAQGQSSGAEDNASGDADGDPDTWEQGSQASTVIENPSDCEEFAAEHGVPAASTEQVDEPNVPHLHPQHVVEVNPADSNVNPQVSVAGQLDFAYTTPNALAPTPAAIIAPPPPAGNAAFEEPLAGHPFGPAVDPQPMATGYLSPDLAVTMNMPFPNNPGPADSYFNYSQGAAAWAWGSELQDHNNMLGINVAPAPNFTFGTGAADLHASAAFDTPDQVELQAPSFLAQLASNELPEAEPAAFGDLDHPPAPAPASHSAPANTRPIAPLPRPRMTALAPSTPRVSSPHLASAPRAATPMGSPFPFLADGHARPFTRSFSAPSDTPVRQPSLLAPFETPVRRPSLQLKGSHVHTRPSTPVGAFLQASPDEVFEPPHSPFTRNSPSLAQTPSAPMPEDKDTWMQDIFEGDEPTSPFSRGENMRTMVPAPHPPQPMRGVSIVHTDREPEDPDFVVGNSSLPLHTRKKIRLVPPRSHAPTMNEIRKNKDREYASIRKKRKYAPPKAGASAPRVGTHMGLFSREHQEYMFIFRSSLSADVVMIAPWSEPEADMVKRAIARSDAATGLRNEDVVKGEFEATAMRGLSSCRSQFADPVLRLVKTRFKDVNKANVQELLAGDQFMYASDAKLPREFGDTAIMRDVVMELFFSNGLNLGGLFMEDMLKEDSLEVRRKLLTLRASAVREPVPSSFDYTDMSSDALQGPPLASLAFAGIAIRHALKKIEGTAGKFEEASYGEAWARYVTLLVSHPRLGAIRSKTFEEMKLRYSSLYCQGHRRDCSFSEPRAWEWR